jgi:2-dehydropantoate 2-reductase
MVQSVTESALNVAIVGAGSLGQAFATLLAAGGNAPTLVATERTASKLLGAGRIVLEEEAGTIVVDVVETLPRRGSVFVATRLPRSKDVGLIFATKAHQLKPAAIAAHRDHAEVSWVAGLQNGLAKDDILCSVFSRSRVVGAATIFGAQRQVDGVIRVTSRGKTFLGEFGGAPSPRVDGTSAVLSAAGIPCEARDDILAVLWTKACNAVGAFGVSVLAGPDAPGIGYDRDLMRAFITLARETAAVGKAEGVQVKDLPEIAPMLSYVTEPLERLLDAVPPAPTFLRRAYPSMLQDRMAGRPMEVEEVFGDIVERGRRSGVPVPCVTLVRDLLRGINGSPGRADG